MNCRVLLKVSLGLNVALLCIVLAVMLQRSKDPNNHDSVHLEERPIDRLGPRPATPTTMGREEGLQGKRPVTSNWRDWIELVRDTAPTHVLAAMVEADFDARWRKDHDELYRKYVNGEVDIDELALHGTQREIELEREMRDALGEHAFQMWDQMRLFVDINLPALNLTADETNALYQLRKELQQRCRQLEMLKLSKAIDQFTYDLEYERAEADYHQQLKALLGFERYAKIKGDGIPPDVKRALRDLNVKDEQLANLRELETKWVQAEADLRREAEQGILDSVTFDMRMEELHQWRREQLQQLLGPDAYAHYERQQDRRYVDMVNYATEWKLSHLEIAQVYAALKQHDKTVRELQRQCNIAAAAGDVTKQNELKAAMQQVTAKTTQHLADILGLERFEILKRNKIVPGQP